MKQDSPFIYDKLQEWPIDEQTMKLRYSCVEAELHNIIFLLFDNIFVTDHEGRIIFQNPASERMLGFCSMWPRYITVQECMEAGIYDRSTALEAIRTGKRVTGLVRSRDASLMSISAPLFDEQGNLKMVVTSSRNTEAINQFLTKMIENERMEKDRLQSLATCLGGLSLADSPDMTSHDPGMRAVLNLARAVATSDSTILLSGESGTGKDLVARYIHRNSSRTEMPFIPVNCAAIPHELLESELFGHEKGAFTGAWRTKPGLFELADRGTLFLDEVGDLPFSLQSKLLRALESGEIQRLGGTKLQKVSVRIITATNKNLSKMVAENLFREDLFYRLNVIPVALPPLRERKADIIPLARLLLDEVCKKNGHPKSLSPGAADVLTAYSWPGNIRELRNIIERLAVITPCQVIDRAMCQATLTPFGDRGATSLMHEGVEPQPEESPLMPLKAMRDKAEADYLRHAFRLCNGDVAAMATILDVHRSGLYRKLCALGLR